MRASGLRDTVKPSTNITKFKRMRTFKTRQRQVAKELSSSISLSDIDGSSSESEDENLQQLQQKILEKKKQDMALNSSATGSATNFFRNSLKRIGTDELLILKT